MSFGQKLGGFIGKIAPALGPLGAIGGAILQNRSNKKLAQYSFNKNVEMWKMQNAYNSPKQQMARYNEAGLNPNLMYGKGTSGNAQTMPQYQALPSSGDVFGQSVAGIQGVIEIKRKKEETAILEINKEIRESTAVAETTQKIDEAAITWYQKAIMAIDQTQKKYGLDNADQTLKVLFQSMMQGQPDKPKEYTDDKIMQVLKGVTITKDVAKVLSTLGLGALIGKSGKSKGPKETQTITTKVGKNRTVKTTRTGS
jgi:hypothetical protein